MNLEPRQLDALVLAGIGILLMIAAGPLAKALAGSPHLLLAGIHLLYPVGVIFLLIGIYRYFRKDSGAK